MNILNVTTALLNGTPEIVFEPRRFVEMLPYMGKGMLVIFILIGVIVLVTMLINLIFSKTSKNS